MAYIIPTENRPDLAVGLSVKALSGAATFIAPKIFPALRVSEKTGTITAAKVVRGTATKNRTAGAALAGTRVDAIPVTWTVNRYEGRDWLDDTDIRDAGGIENAVASAVRGAGYDAIKLYEKDAFDALSNPGDGGNDGIDLTADGGDVFSGLAKAAQAVKDYGKPTLVCSESFLIKFAAIPAVRETLVSLFGHGYFREIHNIGPVSAAVGSAFGISDILVGDDEFWNLTAAGKTYGFVAALRPGEMGADVRATVKRLPSLGFAPTYLPENGSLDEPFAVSTVFLGDTKRNAVDVDLFAAPVIVNPKGVVQVQV